MLDQKTESTVSIKYYDVEVTHSGTTRAYYESDKFVI